MIIRQGTLDDLAQLMSLAREYHIGMRLKRFASWEESQDSWQSFLTTCLDERHPSVVCFVAEVDEALVGFVTAIVYPAFWNPSVVFVSTTVVWVSPEQRRQKIGSQLFDTLEAWAQTFNAAVVSTNSSRQNWTKTMQEFVFSRGYTLSERVYEKEKGK